MSRQLILKQSLLPSRGTSSGPRRTPRLERPSFHTAWRWPSASEPYRGAVFSARGSATAHIPSADTRDLKTAIEARPDTPGLARKEPDEKLLIEVLDRPVTTEQTLRFPAGHAVRADRASLKSAFMITHVQRGRPVWRVQDGVGFGSKPSLMAWNCFNTALCRTYSDSAWLGCISLNH